METFGKILGVLIGLAFIGMIAIFGYEEYWGSSFQESSRAYVNDAIPTVLSTWSADELIKRGSPHFLAAANTDQLKAFMRSRSRYGKLESFSNVDGHALISFSLREGKQVTADYQARAKFSRGEVDVSLRLVLVDDEWKIWSFFIPPPPFDS